MTAVATVLISPIFDIAKYIVFENVVFPIRIIIDNYNLNLNTV